MALARNYGSLDHRNNKRLYLSHSVLMSTGEQILIALAVAFLLGVAAGILLM